MLDRPEYLPGFCHPVSDGDVDRRLDAPAFHRNQRAVAGLLVRLLGERTGNVLEIGSGTGQHIVRFAETLPELTWWPSDPWIGHRDSIAAWRESAGLANLMPPFLLDAGDDDWGLGADGRPPATLTAIVCLNVLQVVPWAVTDGILRGAVRHLAADGVLAIYGPFAREGAHRSESNAAFDAALRARDPAWGVRDIGDVRQAAARHGLRLAEMNDMPANNQTLIFRRDSGRSR